MNIGTPLPATDASPASGSQNHDLFKNEYGIFTVDEMAERMKCSPEVVREREVVGEIFAVEAPGRDGGLRYPAFQLNEQVNKPLLKQVIRKYRDENASATLLWQLLRTPQKFFSGFTPMEILLGCSFAEYEALTAEERCIVFLDFITEELSQSRLGPA